VGERKVIDASPAAITLAMLARHRTCWSRRPWFDHGSAGYEKRFPPPPWATADGWRDLLEWEP